MTWLLVEDDTDIRNVVSVMMTVWGEKPLAFPDGNATWAWLDSVVNGTFKGELPDLALMDIRMPGHTGDKLAARIRETAPIKDIPIILMTAYSMTDVDVKTMIETCGVDHLMNKPLPDMDIFRALLYRIRDERRIMLKARFATPEAKAESSVAASAPATEAAQPGPTTESKPTQPDSSTLPVPAVESKPVPPETPKPIPTTTESAQPPKSAPTAESKNMLPDSSKPPPETPKPAQPHSEISSAKPENSKSPQSPTTPPGAKK